MKFLVSILVFAATLTLGLSSLAEEGHKAEGGHSGGGHGNLAEKMNALFPPHQPNTALAARPNKPELEAPTFYQVISGGNVTLKWKETEGATAYHVQVATDPNFKWLVKDENLYKGNTIELSGLEAGKHYFWRVSGQKADNKAGHTQGMFASSMFETSAK